MSFAVKFRRRRWVLFLLPLIIVLWIFGWALYSTGNMQCAQVESLVQEQEIAVVVKR